MSWIALALGVGWACHAIGGCWLGVAGFAAVIFVSMQWTSSMRVRQKIQLATWSAPSEGIIHGKISLDASRVLQYIEEQQAKGKRVSITHVVGKGIALAVAKAPSINGYLLWDKFIPHSTVDVSFLVAIEGGNNLARAKVSGADRKSVHDIADELARAADKLRAGKDANFNKSLGPIRLAPVWAVRVITFVGGWLAGSLGVDVPAIGIEKFPFGAAVVTSVGMFGIEEAYAPMTPFTRVPLLALVGAIKDGVGVRDGQVVATKKVKITITMDHRFIDGAQTKAMLEALKSVFSDPHKHLEASQQ